MHSSARISNQEEVIFRKLQVFLKMRRDHCSADDSQRSVIEKHIAELFEELDELYGEIVDRREWLSRMTDNGTPEPSESTLNSAKVESSDEPTLPPVLKKKSTVEAEKIYIPDFSVLEKWRLDAKHSRQTIGDRDDTPRRLLVLLDSLEALLAREGLSDLVTNVKPSDDRPVKP